MADKQWRSCRFMINGLAHKLQFNQATIDNLFVPFLQRLSRKQQATGKRFLLLMAAPPGVGKSTLALLMEKLSQTEPGIVPVQSIGLDGFHHSAAYLKSTYIRRDGQQVLLNSIKGAPETFDLRKLLDKLSRLHQDNVRWPIYDRNRHDVLDNMVTIKKPLIILEGNWLLLGEDGWQEVRNYADYTLFLTANPGDLKERLITRKMRGGRSRAEAEKFYEKSDRPNVMRVLSKSWPADETWQMLYDGDYQLKGRTAKVQMVDREALWKKPEVALGDSALLNSLNRRLASRTPEEKASGKGAYEEGYIEGLLSARVEIIRRLRDGGMSREQLQQAFQLSDQEIGSILNE